MGLFSRLDRHARLVERMADTLGVDLAGETMRGRIAPQDLRSALVRCTGCRRANACCTWLDAHPDGASAAPDYCCNKGQLERLAAPRP